MKWLGIFLVAGAVLAAAQAAATLLAILLLIGLVIALFTCPGELFGLIALGLIIELVQEQPLAFLAVIAFALFVRCLQSTHDHE